MGIKVIGCTCRPERCVRCDGVVFEEISKRHVRCVNCGLDYHADGASFQY